MLAEGKNPVKEALNSSLTIEKIVCQDGTKDAEIRNIISLARERKIQVEFAPRQALDRMSQTGHHQGIIALTSEFKYYSLDDCLKEKNRFFVILDKISDPHNLGSVLRTAECVGVTAVIIPSRNSALVNETVLRTSAGAANHVKVVKVPNLNDAIKKIKQENIFVFAADMDGQSMYETNLTGEVAIIIGSEGNGVSPLTKKLADQVISIPMRGHINSLNASVSAAIIMYEVVRQGRK